jgi:hypothetical protein
MAIIRSGLRSGRKVTINSNVYYGVSTVADDTPGVYDENIKYELALFQNAGATNIFILYGTGTVSSTNFHVKATPGTQIDLNDIVGERISVISDASSGLFTLTLATPDSSTSYPAQPANNINGY